MRDVDARVTGFDYTTFHAYTTEVEVDGCTWTLNIRYNTFYQFYERLLATEKYFMVKFPPKGSLFFSPAPEDRQEQLDEFMLSTLAYFDMRGHPKRMEALLSELLQIPEHLSVKDDEEEEERTASEGSSEEHEDDLESGHENENHSSQPIVQDENKVEAVVKVNNQGLKSEVEDDDILMQRPAIETAAVSIRKENVDESKDAKMEKTIEEQESVKDDRLMESEVETQQKKAAVAEVEEKSATPMVEENTATHEELVEATTTQAVIETTVPLIEPDEHVLESVAPIEVNHEKVSDTMIELNAVSISAPQAKEDVDSEEPDLEPCNKEAEPENLVVATFDSSSNEKEEQEAVEKQVEEEEKEVAAQAETKATKPKACTKTEEEVKAEAIEAELLLAAQELNLRLKRYRYPVFFRSFNYNVGTPRFSLPQPSSSGIFV